MSNKEESTGEQLAITGMAGCLVWLFTPMAVLLVVFQGWVLSTLWSWLIVPSFGLDPITFMQGACAILVIGYVNNPYNTPDKEGTHKYTLLLGLIMRPFIYLLCGYILTFFI